MQIRRGIPASAGIAVGEAFLVDVEEFRIPRKHVPPETTEAEVQRARKAFERTSKDLFTFAHRAARAGPAVTRIIEGYRALLTDPVLLSEVSRAIVEESQSAEYAVSSTIRRKLRAIESWGQTDFSRRIEEDFIQIERALLRHLLGGRGETIHRLKKPVILVASNLLPTQTATLDRKRVLGIATDKGGRTSHTSIVASALGIPAVVGLGDLSRSVSGGDTLIVDGSRGTVIINPDPATLERYRAEQMRSAREDRELLARFRDRPGLTKDGQRIQLLANIEFPEELPLALEFGAEGVGLYRTEYLYLSKGAQVTEQDHLDAYRRALQMLGGRPLTIRTLDLGADKLPLDGIPEQANPFLGLRAIRLCLERVELLESQLRAILRVASVGPLSIMIPMVSTREEILRVREIVHETLRRMGGEGEDVPVHPPPIGIMVEVPSAALGIHHLAPHADFFSIGTNDLVAYLMAIDRTNEKVAHLYQGAHPSVLFLLKYVVEAARRFEKPVSLCGEIAGEPKFVPLLVGMGLRTLSLVPHVIPEVKRVLAAFTVREAEKIARHALGLPGSREIEEFLEQRLSERIPAG